MKSIPLRRFRSALLALPCFWASALAPLAAQDTPSPGSPDIICAPVEGKDPEAMVGPIVMGKMKIPQVLDLLRDYSGRVILPGEGLPSVELTFNSGEKLARREAIFALENLLALNGVVLRLLDNGFVRAIPAVHPDNNAPPLIDEIPEDAASEQVYTKLFELEYFDSNTAYYRIRGLISTGSRGAIVRLNEKNALLVSDSLVNLKRIEEILEALDRPPESRLELYTFPVEHGNAWNIRRSLYQVFRTEMNNRLRRSLVYVDSRTNKLIVVTHPENRQFFADFVEEMDEEIAPFTTTAVIRIEEGNYWRIWSVIRGVVSHQQRQFSRRGFYSEERDEGENRPGRVTASGATSPPSTEAGDGGGGGTETGLAPAETATGSADPTALMTDSAPPELQFSPYIGLYADPSNDAFVVYGTQNDIARMRALIGQLDVKSAPYVQVEVFDVRHARANDLRNVINYTIYMQRRNFSRARIRSGTAPGTESGSAPDAGEQGFEYSDFVATIADRRNNTILVQGTARDIAQIGALIEKLDVKSAPLTSNEIIYLEHAEARTLARVIQNIINYQRYRFARQRQQTQAAPDRPGGAAAGAPEIGFEFSDYAVVNADRRTNALFVYGTSRDIERVKSIVADSDIPVEPITTTRVMPLTHTEAARTASLVNRVIRGQERALRQVRSESREVANPAARESGGGGGGADAGQAPPPDGSAGIVEGDEALQFSAFVSVTPDRRSNSIIVYGTRSDIRQVETLVDRIDIEVAPLTQSKVFLLENAQARSLYGVLNSVVRGQERALRQVRSAIREIRNLRPEDSGASAAELTLEALQFSPYVTITPNTRNNSIIVYGTGPDIDQLEDLIRISDVEIAPKTQSRTFFIRHADANEVASTISNLIRQQQRVRERERTLTRVFRRQGLAEGDGENGENGRLETETFAEPADTGAEVVTESATQVYSDLFSFDEDLQFSPYVSLVADDRSNSVLAYGTEFDLEQIARLIDQIDDVLPQVRIEVVIAEVILGQDQVTGLNSFGISYNTEVDNRTDVTAQAPPLDESAGDDPAFDLGFSLNDFSLDTIFRVAKEDSNVKVLSAPSVTTTHNRPATINVGEARPIITSSASNLNNPDLVTRSTVEYRDIGITLRVRPLVSSKGFIQLDLEQVVETVIDTQTIDNNQQPIISTRRASSFLSVRDREVIVLGGLQQVDNRERDGSVFLLGDLPVVGGLFRPEDNRRIVRELVIFIKPYLVESFEQSELMSREELDRTGVGEDIEFFLEKGRFREQDQLRQDPENAGGNLTAPPAAGARDGMDGAGERRPDPPTAAPAFPEGEDGPRRFFPRKGPPR